jgi:tetratricopeptide (TPR) repeat protein
MSVPEPPDVARELSIVEAALDRHDLHHAVHHLGTVLRLDPASARAGGLLDRIAAAAPEGGLALLPSQALSAEGAAVRACLLARRGLLDDAVGLVFSLSLAVPEVPFATLALGWLADPAAAAKVRPEVVTDCSVAIFDRYPDGVEDPALRHAQEPLLETFALVLAAHPDADQAHCMALAAARRLGRNDLAIAWARQVLEREPSYPAALMLGYALRDDGRPVEAEAAFRRAIELDPREPLVRVDLAELLCDNGRAKDGLAELDHVLREEPEHARARPSATGSRSSGCSGPIPGCRGAGCGTCSGTTAASCRGRPSTRRARPPPRPPPSWRPAGTSRRGTASTTPGPCSGWPSTGRWPSCWASWPIRLRLRPSCSRPPGSGSGGCRSWPRWPWPSSTAAGRAAPGERCCSTSPFPGSTRP